MKRTSCVCGAVLLVAVCFGMVGAETIDIAAIYALSGIAAEGNASSLLGVQLAVDEINAAEGLLGRKIKLLAIDNKSTPVGSVVAAEEAVVRRVVAIIGAAWSSHSIPIARVAQQKGIPMIATYSTNPAVTAAGNYIFRVCFVDTFQGSVMARFARRDLGARTALLFTNLTSEYSMDLSRYFRSEFVRDGGSLLGEAQYKIKQTDVANLVETALEKSADVVFISGHSESRLIARKFQEAGVQSVLLGGDGWAGDNSLLEAGDDALRTAYYCSHWSPRSTREQSRRFVARYGSKRSFDVGAALAYDAVMLLADAVRRAGSVDRIKVRDALAATSHFEGVTGVIGFNAERNPVKSAVIMEITNGIPRYLKTVTPE
ncbi:MAG: ABC transporter substrate-binding protein [Deltaproteobacteria bacterium]|nr:ABC transporter substrate-binding protein [Deltaproteobacteria bacterium]